MKKLDVKKENKMKKEIFKKFEIFCENHPSTRHAKYKVISFASGNTSIKANKLPSTILERFLRRIESPLRVIARNISRVNCPELAKMAIFKLP